MFASADCTEAYYSINTSGSPIYYACVSSAAEIKAFVDISNAELERRGTGTVEIGVESLRYEYQWTKKITVLSRNGSNTLQFSDQ